MNNSTRQSASSDLQLLLAERERRRRQAIKSGALEHSVWSPDLSEGIYVNRETGKRYRPHNEQEAEFTRNEWSRYLLLKGGEGGGKSVAGIIKDLERLRRGMSGVMGSPDFEHFKRSLWPEFQRWCPPKALVGRHRHRLAVDWAPPGPFLLVFVSGGTLLCGGFESPGSWEGPNLSFGHFDEARRHAGPGMLKVLDGRCRIMGRDGVEPQIWFTTTPRKHWLYEYFVGPLDPAAKDPFEDFRRDAAVYTIRTSENADNLSTGFAERRAQTLSATEASLLLDAEWEDIDDVDRFLPSMILWDRCNRPVPIGTRDRIVLAADAATGRLHSASDCFALVSVCRHPDPKLAKDNVVVRYVNDWQARAGHQIDFLGDEYNPGPEREVRRLCAEEPVYVFTFDPMQLVDMGQRLEREGVIWCDQFPQGTERAKADKMLFDVITSMRLWHAGEPSLRSHIDNADRKVDELGSKTRLIKGRGKIDLAVALSMGVYRCLELNL